ncbi:MAG TPA: hypothetical protein VGM91_19140 [Conexibacter sp.]|jgi:antirestriction protein ArdC
MTYAEEELLVEAVAYTVCGSIDFDTSSETVPYLASWAQAAPLAVIEAAAKGIDRLATRIENALGEMTPVSVT